MSGEVSAEQKDGAQLPTAREVAAVLFRQRLLVSVTFLAIFLGIAIYGVCVPSYRAEMKLLVRKGRVDPPVAPAPTAISEFSRYEVTEEEINSEVELLQDADVLRPVVMNTGLQQRERVPWLRTADEGEARITRAVRHLAGRLEVKPVRKTHLIAVTYESDDPGLAARVLRELSSIYLRKHLIIHRPAGESAFFQEQTQLYTKALNDADGRLLGVIRTQGVVDPLAERDLTLQKLSEADANYRQIVIQLQETEERISALQRQLPDLPERRSTEIRAGDNPELLQQLKSTLLGLQLKRTELLTKYQPNYRLVQEVQQQIADTQAAIAGENLQPVRQEASDNNPRYDWAAGELTKAQVEAQALRARESAAAATVRSYREAAIRLGEQAITHADLVRSAKVAEENYLLYVRKREEAHIGDALDAQGILNVALAQEPAVPAIPKWSLGSITALALLAGFVSSLGIGFVADYLDPSYRTPEELSASLGVPALASIPRKAA